VTYAAVLGVSPLGAAAPAGISTETAAALQAVVMEFMAADHGRRSPWPLDRVRRYLLQEFNGLYWAYVRDVYFRRERGVVAAAGKALRHRLEWHLRFSRLDSSNPLA